MSEIRLKIGDLILDHDNPRITHAEGQQEALQKIVKDQRTKLVKLAQSIVEKGLNPMDRFLVLRLNLKPEQFIALEGNRRVAVLKMLTNPQVMTGLDMPPPMRNILNRLAQQFAKEKIKSKIEPLPCFELPARQDGDYWLRLRHKGQQQGAGIVDWSPIQSQRFESRSPAVQVLDTITERGGLTADQRTKITDKFPLTTLQRILETRDARATLGIDIKKGKVVTRLPASEAAKALRRIVHDLATKARQVGSLMKKEQIIDYVNGLGDMLPDLSKARRPERALDEIPISEFPKVSQSPKRKPDPSRRKEVVPKTCVLNVTDNRVAEIYSELRTLKLDDARNAIAVLLRVFLEMSVDHFLEKNNVPLRFKGPDGKERWKGLDRKLSETVDILVNIGEPRSHYASIIRSLSVESSPMNVSLFHLYVHERFATPSPSELTAAWNNAQRLFERIWA